MYRCYHCFGTCIAIGIHRIDRFILIEQHIVYAPGIDGKRFNLWILLFCLRNALLHMRKQRVNVPAKVSVNLFYTVRKAVNFFCLQRAVLRPPHDMPAA